jgi:MoxR-like ATPase
LTPLNEKLEKLKELKELQSSTKLETIVVNAKTIPKSSSPTGFDIIGTRPEDHIVESTPNYVELQNENAIFDAHLKNGHPMLISGPKGCGKTLAIASWACQKKVVFIQYDCNEGTKESHLIGRPMIASDGTTPFKLGIIPTIIELANKAGIAVLVLEEINALNPAMQKLLNPLLDWRTGIFVEALEKEYRLKPGCQVLVFGTANPSSYMGVNELNEDLKSRFAIWKWNYPTLAQERSVVDSSNIPDDFVKGLFKLAQETRALADKGEIEYALSTRDIAAAFSLYRTYQEDKSIEPARTVLELKVLGNFDIQEQIDTVKSRMESIFGKRVFGGIPDEVSEDDLEKQSSEESDDY